MVDTEKNIELRRKMVFGLKKAGIKDRHVLEAIGKAPRHKFFNSAFSQFAYQELPFLIGEGQFISSPYAVAYQTELLEVKEGHKILEIGTGSGYQAAILNSMGAVVFTIERRKKLYEKAKTLLESLKYHITCVFGDGIYGLPEYAPYDRIIVTTAPEFVTESLLEQLKVGGVMVIPVGGSGEEDERVLKKIKKNGEGEYEIKNCGLFR
jgi:protein-L-isoaspartate(D-aspartate) O-methyltransferase